MHQAQEGDDILDLPPPIETLRTHQPVGKPRLQERLFEQTRHGVRTVHHRALARFNLAGSDQLGDGIHHEGRLGIIVGRFIEEDLFPRTAVAKKTLFPAVLGAIDHAHGGIQNGLSRAVVLLEQNGLGFGEILVEALDVAPVGAAPGIDRLVRITHTENITVKRCQMLHQRVLGQVGILEFIHEHVAEALGIFVADRGDVLQQVSGVKQDIVEIHRIAGDQPLLIFCVDTLDDLVAIGLCRIIVCTDQLILGS